MNEAQSQEQEFLAAVIQLRQGQRSNVLKFGAVVLLVVMFAGGLIGFSLSIGDAVKEMFNGQGDVSAVPEVDVP